MAVNDIIRKTDYNDLRDTVAAVVGTSDGTLTSGDYTYGWGQAVNSSQVSESSKVTVNEWGLLRYDIVNAYLHLTGDVPPDQPTFASGSSIQVPNVNDLIRWDVAGSTPLPYWVTDYLTYIETNRFALPPASRRITTNHTPTLKSWNSPWGTSADPELRCTVTMEFNTAQEARHFFNSGSRIRFQSYFTPTRTDAQNLEWETVLDDADAQEFGGHYPTSGTGTLDGGNFYRCTNTYISAFYSLFASGRYTDNEYRIFARTPDVADNTTGSAKKIEFQVSWLDAYTDPPNVGARRGNFPPEDGVDGLLELSVITLQPFGVMQPAGTPDFEVSTPTITVGPIFKYYP